MTGYTPFQLVYRQQAILPIEVLLPVEPQEETEIDLQDSILHRAFELIDKLPDLQNDTQEKTRKSQQKQKEYFDTKIHLKIFEIGNKVWIQRKELKHSQFVKFEDKRTGPFIIQEKLNNRAYKLCDSKGKLL